MVIYGTDCTKVSMWGYYVNFSTYDWYKQECIVVSYGVQRGSDEMRPERPPRDPLDPHETQDPETRDPERSRPSHETRNRQTPFHLPFIVLYFHGDDNDIYMVKFSHHGQKKSVCLYHI